MTEELKDKFLFCIDCEEEFAFPVSAQEYFISINIHNDPERCRSCFKKHKKEKKQNQ